MTTLSVKSALLKAASIEVKALTVNSKQMTLAVFRQLDQRDFIIGDDSEELDEDVISPVLAGLPWGRVNYHPDKCGENFYMGEHLHVIWQQDIYLYRCTVPRDPKWARLLNFNDSDDWIRQNEKDLELRRKYDVWISKLSERIAENDEKIAEYKTRLERAIRIESGQEAKPEKGYWDTSERMREELHRYEKLTPEYFGSWAQFLRRDHYWPLSENENRHILDSTAKELMESIRHERKVQADFKDAYAKLYQELSELDLLFIAL